MKRTLIVVGLRHDFYHPSGALYATSGENIVNKVLNIIPKSDYKGRYDSKKAILIINSLL